MNYFVDVFYKCFNNWLYWNYSFKFFDTFMSHIGITLFFLFVGLLIGIGILIALVHGAK